MYWRTVKRAKEDISIQLNVLRVGWLTWYHHGLAPHYEYDLHGSELAQSQSAAQNQGIAELDKENEREEPDTDCLCDGGGSDQPKPGPEVLSVSDGFTINDDQRKAKSNRNHSYGYRCHHNPEALSLPCCDAYHSNLKNQRNLYEDDQNECERVSRNGNANLRLWNPGVVS